MYLYDSTGTLPYIHRNYFFAKISVDKSRFTTLCFTKNHQIENLISNFFCLSCNAIICSLTREFTHFDKAIINRKNLFFFFFVSINNHILIPLLCFKMQHHNSVTQHCCIYIYSNTVCIKCQC